MRQKQTFVDSVPQYTRLTKISTDNCYWDWAILVNGSPDYGSIWIMVAFFSVPVSLEYTLL